MKKLLAGLAVLAAGCTSSHPGDISYGPQAITHDVASIRTFLSIHSTNAGETWVILDGDTTCHVSQVLVNAEDVSKAIAGGAKVAVNKARTIGVAMTGSHRSTCVRDVTRQITYLT